MKLMDRKSPMFNSPVLMCLLTVYVVGSSMSGAADRSRNIISRGSYTNSQIKFEREKNGHVAFIGGSITEMNGYRPMVCEDLQKRYPDTKFTFTAAGISSTCSTTGAFRLNRDVLSQGPVDLFFIEFAVNDDQDAGHARRECIRGMEGIIRQCRKHNPNMDIVVTFFVNPGMLEMLQKGKTPVSMSSHMEVLEYYDVSTIHLAREAADQITAGTLTWKEYGGTHPKPPGNRIGADMINTLLDDAWSKPLSQSAKLTAHGIPEKQLDKGSYSNGHSRLWKLHQLAAAGRFTSLTGKAFRAASENASRKFHFFALQSLGRRQRSTSTDRPLVLTSSLARMRERSKQVSMVEPLRMLTSFTASAEACITRGQ